MTDFICVSYLMYRLQIYSTDMLQFCETIITSLVNKALCTKHIWRGKFYHEPPRIKQLAYENAFVWHLTGNKPTIASESLRHLVRNKSTSTTQQQRELERENRGIPVEKATEIYMPAKIAGCVNYSSRSCTPKSWDTQSEG